MKLSDIMSNAGLSNYAEVALLIFLAVFIVVAIRTFAPSRREEMRRAALMPLDDGVQVVEEPSQPEER
jgi:cbb3-type cytochrome oxidase subunit 3